jgi:hypothetical protein
MNTNNENIEELIEKFTDVKRMLHENPAPQPSKQLITDIKAKMATAVLRQNRAMTLRIFAYKAASIAAVIMIVVAVGVTIFEKEIVTSENIASAAAASVDIIWESDDITNDDSELAMLKAEIEQIRSDMMALQLAESANGKDQTAPMHFEAELIETESDFWKG